MKSQSRGRSATLTNAPALFAAARASAASRKSSVATKQSAEPSKSFGSGSRASCRKFGASRSPRKSSLSAVANVVTRGAGLDENLRPSRRDDPAADDDGGPPAEFEKNRQMTHGYAARNQIAERAPRRRDRRA